MAYMAQWGPKKFVLSPTKIIILEGLTTSVELKSDSENDTSGTAATNTRGLVLRPVSFSVTYTKAAGTDPMAQLTEWESLVGKSHPLYLGDKKLGASSLILNKVDSSNYVFSPKGEVLSVTVNIQMTEDAGGKTSKTTTTSKTSTTKASTSSTSASRAASVYADTVAKKKAMNTTASPADKAAKKVGGIERRLAY